MKRIEYKKLIRDRIKEKIESKGESCEVRVLDDTEFVDALREKLKEEATELSEAKSREEFLSEYADLMVVLDELASHYELSPADIKVALTESIEKKGGFQNKYFLEWAEGQ